jgi:ABC-type transport system substrate-binding protein
LTFTLLLPYTSRALQRAATVVQHDLAHSGVEMRVRSVSWSNYTGRLREHVFEAAVITYPNAPPFDPRPIFHTSGAAEGRNFGQFSDPRTDEILDALEAAEKKELQRELTTELAARLREAYPVTFTFRPYRSVLVRDSIRGVRIRDGWIDERSVWLAEPNGGAK